MRGGDWGEGGGGKTNEANEVDVGNRAQQIIKCICIMHGVHMHHVHGAHAPRTSGHLLVNLGFWIFRFPMFDILCFRKILFGNLVARYRGQDNKVVLDRPCTKCRVSNAISSTLKFQFTVNPKS